MYAYWQQGFTLLEVLIAMAILAFISLGIYQALTETYRLRQSLATEGDFYNNIRLSMTLVQRDIALIYTPALLLPDSNSPNPSPTPIQVIQAQLAQQPQGYGDPLSGGSVFWSPAINNLGIRPSHFIGSDNKISFIALSHIRIYKDSHESEFAKITYEIKPDSQNTDPKLRSLSVLIKTESPNAFSFDDTSDKSKHTYELLHGIKKISYSYYRRDGNTWKTTTSWDSESSDTQYIYPDMIELNLTVVGPNNMTFEGSFKFRPEIPINGLYPST